MLLAEHQGIISWRSAGADEKRKKQIFRLGKLLKSIFPGLAGNPFYPYRQYKAYKIRFKLEISSIEEYSSEDEDETLGEDKFRKPYRRYEPTDKKTNEPDNFNDGDD